MARVQASTLRSVPTHCLNLTLNHNVYNNRVDNITLQTSTQRGNDSSKGKQRKRATIAAPNHLPHIMSVLNTTSIWTYFEVRQKCPLKGYKVPGYLNPKTPLRNTHIANESTKTESKDPGTQSHTLT